MIPDASQTPDTSEAAAEAVPVAVPAATAVPAAVDAAAVVSEARVSSPPLATLTIVMPVTPVVIAPLPPEPASVIQVMPSGDDHTVSQSTDTVLDTDSVCGVQSDTSVSVCRVQPPPLSPVSVLSSSSSDVCIVAVEITPVKPRPENRPDARSLNAGGAVLPHTIKIDVDGSENISGDEFSRAVTSDNVGRDIESECFVDSLPTLQMLTLRAINDSEASLSSPSHSDIVPPVTVRETDILTSSNHPIVIVDSSDSETTMPAIIDSVDSIQSKQSSSHQIPKKTHAINSESAHPSAVSSSQGVCKPVASETRWVKVGRSAAAQAIAGPSTKNSVVSSSRNVFSDATAGLAGKRRIIEITPVGDANSKAPPSKKICTRTDSAAPNTAVSARLPHLKKLSSPGFVSSAIRNVVLVPKTNRLNPTPETAVTPVVNLSEKDLRSVVVNLHNEKVMKPSDRSASGRSVCEGDNLTVSGDGKNRVDSRRGRTESQGSTRGGSVGGRGGVTDRGGVSDRGVSERDSRKDCGDARPPSSSRSERENDSRNGNGSRSSSSRGGHDVRSRSSAEDVRSRSSVEDVRSRSSVEDVRSRSSVEDVRSRSSAEDVRSRSSAEDVRSRSSVAEVDESLGRDGSHKVCIRCV